MNNNNKNKNNKYQTKFKLIKSTGLICLKLFLFCEEKPQKRKFEFLKITKLKCARALSSEFFF